MPDVVLSDYKLTPHGDGGLLPAYIKPPEALPLSGLDLFNKGLQEINKNDDKNSINNRMNSPVVSKLSQAIRYTDPNLGFNPFDNELEYKYADAHPFKTFGNNLAQTGARFLGAAVEAIATIPIAINALSEGDFSKMHDNDLTNGITEWLDGLAISMPTYRTKYEEDHPVLKYINIFKPTSFAGAFGSAVNNLGYTAGAIAGAILQDTIITALTGGVGLLPALGANASKFTQMIGRVGKAAVATPGELAIATRTAYSLADEVGMVVARQADDAARAVLGTGEGMTQSAGQVGKILGKSNARDVILNRANSYYKIRDAVKHELALLTSASAEGAFEAADVNHRGVKEMSDRFMEVWGRAPKGQELIDIQDQARGAADFTLGANIGLLYLSNRLNWGSLFKPTQTAMREGIVGWGSGIKRASMKKEFTEILDEEGKEIGRKMVYSKLLTSPEGRIGKVLLNAQKFANVARRPLGESFEEGSQFSVSEGSLDYVKTKYDPNNLKEVGDMVKSFNFGISNTFNSNEGWDNMMGGFIGGILGGGVTRGFKLEKRNSIEESISNQVAMLNNGGSFNGTLENRFQELATNLAKSKEYKEAVEKGDTYTAKNSKFDLLYNWVSSGVRANSMDRRMDELQSAGDLTGKSFTSYWGMEDTQENRTKVQDFITGIEAKAKAIQKNVEKVQFLTKNPHTFGTPDYKAYEMYKDQLSLNLSKYGEYQRRMKEVTAELKALTPLMDVQKAIKLTSVQGMSEVLVKIEQQVNTLNEQIAQTQDNSELQDPLFAKQRALTSIASRLRGIVYSGETDENRKVTDVNFKGKDYVSAMRDLFDLYNGVSFEQNAYIDRVTRQEDGSIDLDARELNDDELADSLEKLQDIYRLSDANYEIGKYYTYLRKGLGETAAIKAIRDIITEASKSVDANGNIKTPESREEEIRSEAYFDVESGETTAEERVILKNAARKKANGQKTTAEEDALMEKHEEVATAYIKVENEIREQLIKEFDEAASELFNPLQPDGAPKTTNNVKFDKVTPESLFFALHRNPFFKDLLDNLHRLVFRTKLESIGKKFKAVITNRPNPENNFTPIPGGTMYRRDFDEVIQINNNGKVVGELRPPESVFLDEAGTKPMFNAKGEFMLTEADYVAATGNKADTYADFKASSEAYYTAYNNLKKDVKNGYDTASVINKHFSYTVNIGTTDFNKKENKKFDTLLKDVKLRDRAVISIEKRLDQDGKTIYAAKVLDKTNVTEADLTTIVEFVENNQDKFVDFADNIMVAFPVHGNISEQSFVRGRMEGRGVDYENKLKLVVPPFVFNNFTINFRPNVAQAATNTTSTKATTTEPTLPKDLAGAKPRYSYGSKKFTLSFDSDIDKAAYITSQTKKSARDADYLQFVMDATGLTASQVRQLGLEVRASIKAIAKNQVGDTNINVVKLYTKYTKPTATATTVAPTATPTATPVATAPIVTPYTAPITVTPIVTPYTAPIVEQTENTDIKIENLDDLDKLTKEQKEQLKKDLKEKIELLPEDQVYFTHLTPFENDARNIIQNGLKTGVAIESTTNIAASKKSLYNSIVAIIDGKVRHRNSANLVIIGIDRSLFGKTKVNSDNLFDILVENHPEFAGDFVIPAKYNVGLFTNGKLEIVAQQNNNVTEETTSTPVETAESLEEKRQAEVAPLEQELAELEAELARIEQEQAEEAPIVAPVEENVDVDSDEMDIDLDETGVDFDDTDIDLDNPNPEQNTDIYLTPVETAAAPVEEVVEPQLDPARSFVIITQQVEENVTEEEAEQVREELGLDTIEEAKAAVAEAVVEDIKENGATIVPEKKSILSKLVNRIKKFFLALFLAGTIFSVGAGVYGASTGYTVSDVENYVERGLVKYGLTTPEETKLELVKEDAAPVVTENVTDTAYKNSITKFEKLNQDNSGIWSFRNQFMNEDGFTYVAGVNNKNFRENKTVVYKGVAGVAHHMIMLGKAGDLTAKTTDQALRETSDNIVNNTPTTDYIPVMERLADGKVKIKYVLVSEAKTMTGENTFTPVRLRQAKVSDLDFNTPSSADGFKSTVKAVTQRSTGKGFNSLVYTSKDSYGKFSGGSAVLLFKDAKGNLIVREYSGSINGIEAEIQAVKAQFGVTDNDITLGVYDAGSYTGKVGAINGEVSPSRYSGYNPMDNGGSSLMIPETDSNGKALGGFTAFSLLGFLADKRKKNEPIGPDDISAIKARIEELKTQIQAVNQNYAEQTANLAAPAEETSTLTVNPEYVADPVVVEQAVHAANKKALAGIIKRFFGLTTAQANSAAQLFDQTAQAWAKRTGKPVEDFYKEVGIADKVSFDNLENKDQSLYQIVGEKGIANLEKADAIMNALGLAKLMTQRGIYSKQQIRVASFGWELGDDGKWKYEIPDNNVDKKVFNESIVKHRAAYDKYIENLSKEELKDTDAIFENAPNVLQGLRRFLKDSQLLTMYPELAKYKIYFFRDDRRPDVRGFQNSEDKVIGVSTTVSEEEAYSTILHEIQHIIQDEEGFAKGANSAMFKTDYSDKSTKISILNAQITIANKLGYKDAVASLIKQVHALKDQIQEIRKEDHRNYERIAGEAEARNVQYRMNFSDLERLKITLSSTDEIDADSKLYVTNIINSVKESVDNGNVLYQSPNDEFEIQVGTRIKLIYNEEGEFIVKEGVAVVPGYSQRGGEGLKTVFARMDGEKSPRHYKSEYIVEVTQPIREFIPPVGSEELRDWFIENVLNSDRFSNLDNNVTSKSSLGEKLNSDLWKAASELSNYKINVEQADSFDNFLVEEFSDLLNKYPELIGRTENAIKFRMFDYTIEEEDYQDFKKYTDGLEKVYNIYNYVQDITPEVKRVRSNVYQGDKTFEYVMNKDKSKVEELIIRDKDGNIVERRTYDTPREAPTENFEKWFVDNFITYFDNNVGHYSMMLENVKLTAEQYKRGQAILKEYYNEILKKYPSFTDIENVTSEQNDKIINELQDEYWELQRLSKDLSNSDFKPLVNYYRQAQELRAAGNYSPKTNKGDKKSKTNETSFQLLQIGSEFGPDVDELLLDFQIKQGSNDPTILNQDAKGAFDTLTNVIYALTNPDVTTFPHELAHAWEKHLTAAERKIILDWTGQATWTRETSEMWAKGFEVYLTEGNNTNNKKLDGLFNKFAKWIAEVYADIKKALGIELNDAMRGIYSSMLNSEFISPEVKTTIQKEGIIEEVDLNKNPYIGQTNSGKKVYAGIDPSKLKDFTDQDHMDASMLYHKAFDSNQSMFKESVREALPYKLSEEEKNKDPERYKALSAFGELHFNLTKSGMERKEQIKKDNDNKEIKKSIDEFKTIEANKKLIYDGIIKIGKKYFDKNGVKSGYQANALGIGFIYSEYENIDFGVINLQELSDDDHIYENQDGIDYGYVDDAYYLGVVYNKKTKQVEELPGYLEMEGNQINKEFVDNFYKKNKDKLLISFHPSNIDVIVNKKIATQQAVAPVQEEVKPAEQTEDYGFHGGNLGGKSDYLTPGYRGDMPFTGYYFFSNKESAETRGDRSKESNQELSVVDFSKYNLLKPTTNEYWVLKSALKRFEDNFLRGGIDSAFQSLESYGGLKTNFPKLYEEILAKRDEITDAANNWKNNELDDINNKGKIERLETLILKTLGYEGVDVRGLKESNGDASPDTSTEGSVIFDLKENSIIERPTQESTQVAEESQDNIDEEQSYTIEEQAGIDGENQITVVDRDGNLQLNPDNDMGTFDTVQEAQAFIDAKVMPDNGIEEEVPPSGPTVNVQVEQPVVEETKGTTPKITRQNVKATSDGEGGFNVMYKNTPIGSIIEDEEDGTWHNADAKANTDSYLAENKKGAIDEIVKQFNINNGYEAESTATEQYVKIRVEGKDIPVKLVIGGDTTEGLDTFEDVYGNRYEKPSTNRAHPEATLEEFEKGVEFETKQPIYKVGEKVTTLEDGDYVIVGIEYQQIKNTTQREVFYFTDRGVLISENTILGITEKTLVEKNGELDQDHVAYNIRLNSMANKFKALFPQIKFETGYYDFKAPARFHRGKVQINFKYVTEENNIDFNEAVAHEFMHPFVEALKISNPLLYDSLMEELAANHQDIINEVKANDMYDKDQLMDEALTIYLGRELNKAFDKVTGNANQAYIASRSLLGRFVDWLRDLVDMLMGSKQPKSLETLINDLNIDVDNQRERLKNRIQDLPDVVKNTIKKSDTSVDRKINSLLSNRGTVEQLMGKDAAAELYEAIDNYKTGIADGDSRFKFVQRTNNNHYVEFDETDENNLVIYIDPQLDDNASAASILMDYGKRITDAQLSKDFIAYVKRNGFIDKSKVRADNRTKTNLQVKDINPLMKLQDLSDFLVTRFGDGNTAAFQYNSAEFEAINTLEAYLKLDGDQATRARKIIVGKMETLDDTAKRRLKSESLKLNYNIINRANLDIKDDAEFVLEYIQQASVSINAAWRKYNALISDLKNGKGSISKPELERLNKELGVVRQLISFYDEFTNYTEIEFNTRNPEDVEAQIAFAKSASYITLINQGIKDVAINLAVESFVPYMNTHNKYMAEAGYTDPKYVLSEKKLYQHFKYGVGKDTNFITFWLGSNITSRNPINALFANTLADAMSFNNIDTNYDATTVNIDFQEFLTRTGISNLNTKAQIDYYKDNYMRKANVFQRTYNKVTNKYEEEYIEKWALHQEYFFDKYEKDLDAERAKYKNPRNSAEQDAFDLALEAWKAARNNGRSAEYKNAAYSALASDTFFKSLEKHYNDSNERYGENGLRFGVIPQKYDANVLAKIKRVIGEVVTPEKIKEKFDKVKEALQADFTDLAPDEDVMNLDGSVFKTIKTNLTNVKLDENVSLNLHESIVDFVVESRNYSTLKETQYQAETLSLLLGAKTKFDIPARNFSIEDLGRKLNTQDQVRKAKALLKEMDKDRAAGNPVDDVYYKELEAKVAKGVEVESVWEKMWTRLKPAKTNYNNEMLLGQINDVYFGESTEKVNFGNLSANRLAHYLSLYTSVNSMAGNVIAAVSNVNIGNLQLFIEANGKQYFGKKELAKAAASYVANIPNYIQDLQRPIKSKDTQLSFMLDAIQGEIQDEFGVAVTGNIARKMFRTNSLFLLTSVGEHQIQLTNMKAMLLGRTVETTSGEKINMYDAFTADKEGRFEFRADIKDRDATLAKFTRDLHGVNRALNGNYSELNKTMLARKWYGTLALKFRKYLYPAFRTRWASEHTDYERNTVDVGYLRFFFRDYLIKNVANMFKRDAENKANWKVGGRAIHEQVAIRKGLTEIAVYLGITVLAMAAFGGGDDKKKKKLTALEKYMLLYLVRLRSDIGTFSVDMPSEAMRQLKSPTASLSTIVAAADFVQQLWNPNEVYAQKSGVNDKGDSKLGAKFQKLIPGRQLLSIFDGNFEAEVDNKLGYFNLISRNIEGVSPKQSR